jgi:DNA polymerase/3'-5' exonuclease PolX
MSFLKVIDDLTRDKPMRKTKERQIRKQKEEEKDGDDEYTETVKPDVKLPKQKAFRVDATPTTVGNNSISNTATTTTTINTSKDVEVTASMQTSDIVLNEKSVYGVLDENMSRKKSAREPYRTLRESVMRDERRKRKKKTSLKDAGNDDDDEIPFVVYIDSSVGKTRFDIFAKNVPEKLGGLVVSHVEKSIIDSNALLVGSLVVNDATRGGKHKSKIEPKKKKKRKEKKEDEEIGVSHVVTTKEGFAKYEKSVPDECVTKFVSPEYLAACLKEKKIIVPIEEKWSFAAVADAKTSPIEKPTQEMPKGESKGKKEKRGEESHHDEEILTLMELAQISLEQARVTLVHFGYSLEVAVEAFLEGKVSFTEINGEQTLVENASKQASMESDVRQNYYHSLENMKKIKKHFMCQPAERIGNHDANKSLIDMFSNYGAMLQDMYPDNKQQRGRGNAYVKIARLLESTPYELTPNNIDNFIEKNRCGGQGMGESMCNKLKYAVSFKVLPEYEAFLKDPSVIAVKDMSRVHGIGTKTAYKFYKRFNLKSVEDLRALLSSGDPNNILKNDMRISLKYLEDLEDRIPREEAKEIGDFVRESVENIVKGAQVEVAGSYRRGKPTCGDVDVLVCLKENQKKDGVLQNIVDDIDRRGLISARLSQGTFGQDNFMGVCKLPDGKENRKHRRLDIKIYEPKQFATALLYFTGSGRFNRSMRTYTHMMGWHLDDKGLYMDRNKSRRVETVTEQDIFAALGLDYVRPQDRSVG